MVATGIHRVAVLVELADAVLDGLAVILLFDRGELRLPVVCRAEVDDAVLAAFVLHRLPRDQGGLLLQHGLEHGRAVQAGGVDVPHLLDGVGHLLGLVLVGVGDLVAVTSYRELLHGVALDLGVVVFHRVLGDGVVDGHLGLTRGLLRLVLEGCGPTVGFAQCSRRLGDAIGQEPDRDRGRTLFRLVVIVVPGLRNLDVDFFVVVLVFVVLVFGLFLGRAGRTGHGHGRHGRHGHDWGNGHDGSDGETAATSIIEHVCEVVALHVDMIVGRLGLGAVVGDLYPVHALARSDTGVSVRNVLGNRIRYRVSRVVCPGQIVEGPSPVVLCIGLYDLCLHDGTVGHEVDLELVRALVLLVLSVDPDLPAVDGYRVGTPPRVGNGGEARRDGFVRHVVGDVRRCTANGEVFVRVRVHLGGFLRDVRIAPVVHDLVVIQLANAVVVVAEVFHGIEVRLPLVGVAEPLGLDRLPRAVALLLLERRVEGSRLVLPGIVHEPRLLRGVGPEVPVGEHKRSGAVLFGERLHHGVVHILGELDSPRRPKIFSTLEAKDLPGPVVVLRLTRRLYGEVVPVCVDGQDVALLVVFCDRLLVVNLKPPALLPIAAGEPVRLGLAQADRALRPQHELASPILYLAQLERTGGGLALVAHVCGGIQVIRVAICDRELGWGHQAAAPLLYDGHLEGTWRDDGILGQLPVAQDARGVFCGGTRGGDSQLGWLELVAADGIHLAVGDHGLVVDGYRGVVVPELSAADGKAVLVVIVIGAAVVRLHVGAVEDVDGATVGAMAAADARAGVVDGVAAVLEPACQLVEDAPEVASEKISNGIAEYPSSNHKAENIADLIWNPDAEALVKAFGEHGIELVNAVDLGLLLVHVRRTALRDGRAAADGDRVGLGEDAAADARTSRDRCGEGIAGRDVDGAAAQDVGIVVEELRAGHTDAGAEDGHGAYVCVGDVDGLEGVATPTADARGATQARGAHRRVGNRDDAAVSIVAAADACRVLAALGLDDGAAARDVDNVRVGLVAAADAGAVLSARGRDVAARDGDERAIVLFACVATAADAGAMLAARGRDDAAVDGDVARGALVAAADAGRVCTAGGVNVAAVDGNVARRGIAAAADARCGFGAATNNGTIVNGNGAALAALATADAGAVLVAGLAFYGAAVNGNGATVCATLAGTNTGGVHLRASVHVTVVDDDGAGRHVLIAAYARGVVGVGVCIDFAPVDNERRAFTHRESGLVILVRLNREPAPVFFVARLRPYG